MNAGHQEINGNLNVTNTLSGDVFYEQVIETCIQIHDILVDHCGPHATDALIIQDNDGRNLKDRHYAIFTKDGINIVRSIQFVSPIQQHIQSLVAYVGSRVDSRSHDGTTTAMLMFTKMVILYATKLRDGLRDGKLPDHRRMRSDLVGIIQMMSEGFEELTVTVDQFAEDLGLSRREAVCSIAYSQAMLSSKGDKELADAIVEVVATLPTVLYGLFAVSQSKVETDKRFTVVQDDFDFFMGVVANLDVLNHRMGTEYLAESCDLIVSEDDLVRGNLALEGVIYKHVAALQAGELERDLVIVTKSMDATALGAIGTYNKTSKHKIVVFTFSTHKPYSSRVTMLSAVSAVASVHSLQDHMVDPELPYLISGAKVHYHQSRLYLSNLYAKDGTEYHPSYTNPDAFPPYTLMVRTIKEALEEFTSGRRRVDTAATDAMYVDYVEIYRRMISSEVRNLQLSGMRHDTLADRDVLQDAFGAVLSSLEHGFVYDGYLKLYILLRHVDKQTASTQEIADVIRGLLANVHKLDARITSELDTFVISRLEDHGFVKSHSKDHVSVKSHPTVHPGVTSLRSKSDPTTPSLFDKRLDMVADRKLEGYNNRYLHYPVGFEPMIGCDKIVSPTEMTGRMTQMVIQPADSYRELFKRMEDLLPKLLNTSRAIIPNTVNAGSKSAS